MLKRSRPCQHVRRLSSGRKVVVNSGVKKKVNRRYYVTGSKKLKKRLRQEIKEDPFILSQLQEVTKPKMGRKKDLVINISNRANWNDVVKNDPSLKKELDDESISGLYLTAGHTEYNKPQITLFPRLSGLVDPDNATDDELMFIAKRTLVHELDHRLRDRFSDTHKFDEELFPEEELYPDRPGEQLAFAKSKEWGKTQKDNLFQKRLDERDKVIELLGLDE